MAEGEMETPPENAEKAQAIKEFWLKAFLTKLRKRKIIETLAAFIGGGWLPLLTFDHFFDCVRSDPQFQDILRRINFPD